jgi:hypothetical protein
VARAPHAQQRVKRVVGRQGPFARDSQYALDRWSGVARVEDRSRKEGDAERSHAGDDASVEDLSSGSGEFVPCLVVESAETKLGATPRVGQVSPVGTEHSTVSPFERRDGGQVSGSELGRNFRSKASARDGVAPERSDPLFKPRIFGRERTGASLKTRAKFAHAQCVLGLPAQAHDLLHGLLNSHRRAPLV